MAKKTEVAKKHSLVVAPNISEQQQQIFKNEIDSIDAHISLLQDRKKAIQDRMK